LAKTVLRHDQVDEAVELCQRAYVSDPQNAKAMRGFAQILWSQNRHDEAAELYSQLLSINPFHVKTLKNYALLSKDMRKWEESAQAFENLLNLRPKDSYSAYHYSEVLYEQAKNLHTMSQLDRGFRVFASQKCQQTAEWAKKGALFIGFDQTFDLLENLLVMTPKNQVILIIMKDTLNLHLRDLEIRGKIFSPSEMDHYSKFFRREAEISTILDANG
jgi:tetratricopeptide (TPR) repeat protein